MSATTQTPRIRVADTASILRAAYPAHGAKLAARAAGVAYETARDWMRGRSIPSAATLLLMADRDEALAAALARRLAAARGDRAATGPGQGAAVAGGTEVTR